MHRRRVAIPMRPDHGDQVLDDLHKEIYGVIAALTG